MQMAELETMPLIVCDNYDLKDFLANVASAPDKRCRYCYSSRLRITAQAAFDGGFEAFTSSLLYSRYQKHDEIRELGEQIGREYGVPFFYQDFRHGWKDGIRISKELGLYRQQYCGCIYSEKERFQPKKKSE
jgi:predicted adenine nucleotide alpha hydrolase (AANH) superfamily ATPase